MPGGKGRARRRLQGYREDSTTIKEGFLVGFREIVKGPYHQREELRVKKGAGSEHPRGEIRHPKGE